MRLWEIQESWRHIKMLFEKYDHVYVYGAGQYAEALLEWLMTQNCRPYCILVSRGKKGELRGIPVEQFSPGNRYDGAVIMALASKYHFEIMNGLEECFSEIAKFSDDFFKNMCMSQKMGIIESDGKWRSSNLEEIINENKKKKTVILQRNSGLGDVLSLEPVCRALKKDGFRVGLMSSWSTLFMYNESIDFYGPPFNQFIEDNALYISLELAHESRPLKSMLDGYIEVVKQYLPNLEINGEDRIPCYDDSLVRWRDGKIKKICINAEASDWQSRIYDLNRMKEFAQYLFHQGYEIYEVGADRKNYLGVGKDCFGLPLHDSVKIMSQTDLYIGLDNGLMHLAQAIKLPIFVIFGCTCPLYRIHDWSRARVMWKNIDELSCAGCYHRRRIPCIKTECLYDRRYCLDWSVEEVIDAFENLRYNNPPLLREEMLEPIWE